jgi:hypothetical protein
MAVAPTRRCGRASLRVVLLSHTLPEVDHDGLVHKPARLDPVNCRPASPTSDGQRYGETAEVARRYPVLLTYPSVARRDMSGPASSRRGQNRPRGTAVVPTATSDASKQSTTGDDGGRWGRGWTHRRTRSLGWGPKGRRFKSVAGRPLPKRKITLDNLRQGRRADGAAQGDDLGVVIPDHPAIGSVGIAASQRSEPLEALAPYHSALDLPIVRVLADASLLSAVTDTEAP